ncbi:Pyridoxine/pyridoxamine 5'-phosphate oxidase [uncultured Paludibacter sp.]|nr:Pyridoxine/pyridoxamine 5'-phosphate oxidase [uncultured Paludibacter sp.]
MHKDIADIRINYSKKSLDEKDAEKNALDMFELWWNEAMESDILEVNAMTLATVNNGIPNARVVLLKAFDERGFVFFSNYNSQKGHELKENPNTCLVLFWKELERQVRITGIAEKTSVQESIDYFNSRPDGSKIGAWASAQSLAVAGKSFLKETFDFYAERFKRGVIPKPPHWGGYRVKPTAIEFWQGRPSRMHDRLLYTLQEDGTWKIERLQP